MSLLALRNISKSFGGLEALRGVSLEVERHEIVGLWAPTAQEKLPCSA